jgi:hypothetical protein
VLPAGSVLLLWIYTARLTIANLPDSHFYCSENSLQCYNESAEPMADRTMQIRSRQTGGGIDSREQHTEPNTPCSVLVQVVRHPLLYFTHPPSLTTT